MKRTSRGLLRMLLAFFAGVLVTLYFLVPGKSGPTILINGDRNEQIADFGQAGEKIQEFGDMAMFYAYRAKDFIKEKIETEK